MIYPCTSLLPRNLESEKRPLTAFILWWWGRGYNLSITWDQPI